ncbi:GntR family transcriptional regulator [Candidatus Solirubrobacter pratensis]|uniref:GntR family transcriptional regulator n=1 Tax=Candidatus Solirubrobacter pratensis TaxID=1298857 RepID=UPI0004220DAF|nr:GntR family transcriptional regulator [Candidatus Solirubrobacter pratensis]
MSKLTLRLRRRDDEPAWAQIAAQLAQRIEGGELSAGERLPPERALAQAFGVSRMTLRQALDALARRGLVDRGVGRGTFVRAHQMRVEARVVRVDPDGDELRVVLALPAGELEPRAGESLLVERP